MKEKKLSPLMVCHLALTALLVIMSVAAIVSLLSGSILSGAALPAHYKTSMVLGMVLNLINVIALCSGITYILEGYSKRAAAMYKVFLLLTAVSTLFYAVTAASAMTAQPPFDAAGSVSHTQYIVHIILRAILINAAKILLLLVLAFGKDLGKRNTWIIFSVILVLDIIFSVLWKTPDNLVFVRITTVFSRLVMDGTIGLAIRGKYADKDARGTT